MKSLPVDLGGGFKFTGLDPGVGKVQGGLGVGRVLLEDGVEIFSCRIEASGLRIEDPEVVAGIIVAGVFPQDLEVDPAGLLHLP